MASSPQVLTLLQKLFPYDITFKESGKKNYPVQTKINTQYTLCENYDSLGFVSVVHMHHSHKQIRQEKKKNSRAPNCDINTASVSKLGTIFNTIPGQRLQKMVLFQKNKVSQISVKH
jgi:hypothetical protein